MRGSGIMVFVEPADSIRRLGFARWYERRLIEGHAWFVSGFICLVVVFACLEELAFKGSVLRLLGYIALVGAAAALCAYGIFRYQAILVEAERIGERATCPGCGMYGRFRVILPATAHCRKCEHEWQLIV
jgi:hypothetical protein